MIAAIYARKSPMLQVSIMAFILLWLTACSGQDEWVLYKYGDGAVGTFKTLEACQEASKRQPSSRGCYPRGVNPR